MRVDVCKILTLLKIILYRGGLLIILFVGCSATSEESHSKQEIGGIMGGSTQEMITCDPVPEYNRSMPAFQDRTTQWGLDGVEGTNLSVADLNQDGWPDLIVRRGGTRADLLEGASYKRHTWVLMNRGGSFEEMTFEDVTEESGFLQTRGRFPVKIGRPNWVVAAGDIDNDGDLDLYSGVDLRNPPEIAAEDYGGTVPLKVDGERSELLINDGTGHFELTYLTDPLRRVGVEDVPSGAAFVDFDRDGWLDLWLTQGGLGAPMQDILFKNMGEGDLQPFTSEAGLNTVPWDDVEAINEGRAHSTAWSATACDLNKDGTPELLAASYGRAPNHLWLGMRSETGMVTYENISVESGYAFDDVQRWEGDQFARCYCQSNPNADGCSEAPPPMIGCGQMNWNHAVGRNAFRLGGNSGTTLCEDWDGDGDLDLYTSEIRHWWAGEGSDMSEILVNTGEERPRFNRPGRAQTGLQLAPNGSWDEGHITAVALDIDNDGRKELYMGATDYQGNRGLMYYNMSDGQEVRFELMDPSLSIDHHRSHGGVVADFDRDGDLDLIVGHSKSRCANDLETPCYERPQIRAFENIIGNERGWLQLKLEGIERTNRGAVGAWVEVRPLDSSGIPRNARVDFVRGGFGHFGQQDDMVLHFGLGDACQAEVLIRWPDAGLTEQRFRVNKGRYHVRQGDAPVVLEL